MADNQRTTDGFEDLSKILNSRRENKEFERTTQRQAQSLEFVNEKLKERIKLSKDAADAAKKD